MVLVIYRKKEAEKEEARCTMPRTLSGLFLFHQPTELMASCFQ
jgi:hypothetical protein